MMCFDFAKHGRPKVPMRKLSPSQSIKTVIHAPGFYDFALQNLFHARSRAAAEISESRLAYSYNLQGKVVICKEKAPTPNKKGTPKACLSASLRDAAHTRCALFPPNLAFGKEGGQACRSRPHKIPRKSQGVYLTFTPLPAPRRRGLVRTADERGLSPPVSPEPGQIIFMVVQCIYKRR